MDQRDPGAGIPSPSHEPAPGPSWSVPGGFGPPPDPPPAPASPRARRALIEEDTPTASLAVPPPVPAAPPWPPAPPALPPAPPVTGVDTPPAAPPRTPHRHHKARNTLIVLLCVLLVAAAALTVGYFKLNGRLDHVNLDQYLGGDRPSQNSSLSEVRSPGDPYAGRAMNILVLGSDSRAGANAGVSNDVNDGERSDTTFIAHVAADRTRVDLLSIPRDTLITIPACVFPDGSKIPQAGWTKQKFNSAFAYGSTGKGTLASGVACTIRAVEAMSGVRIDGYVVVDFAGFVQIVDAIGGVDLYLPCAVKSAEANNLSLPAGVNHLDGETATNYARARKGVGLGDGSDLGRIQRQQVLFESIAHKALGLNFFTNIGTLYGFVGSVADAVTTDLGSVVQLAGFAYSLRDMNGAAMTFATIPYKDAGDGANVLLDLAKDKPFWNALAKDTPLADAVNPPAASPSVTPSGGVPTTPAPTPTDAAPTEPPPVVVTGPSGTMTLPPGVLSAPAGQCH